MGHLDTAATTGVEPFLLFGRERRALADWNGLRGHLAMPPLVACERAGVRSEGPVFDVTLNNDQPGPSPVQEQAGAIPLRAAILARWDAIEAAGVPLRMSMTLSCGMVLRGLLLPFGSTDGRLGVVRAIVAPVEAPGPADCDDLHAIISSVHQVAPRLPSASAWAKREGALRLLGRPMTQPLPVAERLAIARTWAALGTGGPQPGRAGQLDAALTAAFDVLLAMRADPLALAALDPSGSCDPSAMRVATLVFGSVVSAAECRLLAMALAHGERLGLERGGFAALLGRYPDGYRGLAAAEATRGGDTGQQAAATLDELVLEPLDALTLSRLARHTQGHAWAPRRAAA